MVVFNLVIFLIGKVVYNHESEDPSGVTYLTYNVSDVNGNILTDQRFAITVRGLIMKTKNLAKSYFFNL